MSDVDNHAWFYTQLYLFTWKEFIDVINRIEVFLVEGVGARVHLQHMQSGEARVKSRDNMYMLLL